MLPRHLKFTDEQASQCSSSIAYIAIEDVIDKMCSSMQPNDDLSRAEPVARMSIVSDLLLNCQPLTVWCVILRRKKNFVCNFKTQSRNFVQCSK